MQTNPEMPEQRVVRLEQILERERANTRQLQEDIRGLVLKLRQARRHRDEAVARTREMHDMIQALLGALQGYVPKDEPCSECGRQPWTDREVHAEGCLIGAAIRVRVYQPRRVPQDQLTA